MANCLTRRIRLAGLMLLLPLWLHAAPRVVTLSPANTELAFAAGITPVGVSAWSDYPEAARHITQVADWQGINSERIVALHPDVVIAWRGGNPARPLAQLAALGINIVWVDAQSVDGIIQALRTLSAFSPDPAQGQRAADVLAQRFADLQTRYAHIPRHRVFLQFGARPLFTSSQHTLQGDIVSRCGGDNIFAASRVSWPQVSREQVLSRRPQVVIFPGDRADANQVRSFWARQLTVPFIAVKDDWFVRPGPRIILAAERLCAALAQIPSSS